MSRPPALSFLAPTPELCPGQSWVHLCLGALHLLPQLSEPLKVSQLLPSLRPSLLSSFLRQPWGSPRHWSNHHSDLHWGFSLPFHPGASLLSWGVSPDLQSSSLRC